MGLDVLKREAGAGLVVVVGLGEAGGRAVHLAASSPQGEAGEEQGGFTAHVALGTGAAVFLPGSGPVPEREAWPRRIPLFCAVLAQAMEASAIGLQQDCEAALLPGR
jgi:hypothetical protein